ncbi:MAG: hypothetical protein GYB55_07285 [Cytophagales bacterium]|uniref:hypothetical protein n=1 Tax=Cyclobacterium marinum TaxID=104 RepID=UPI0011F0252F|nr:hypothetical protein [Cyclobacterium marinum]MBI0399108.1 hypothetical protein [Cyclobacterium marinum]MBR9774807.1 hypothetical protein [Cytophagales bacterium]|tara:strand:+ start:48346 stop:49305 length:960 start_codon:yes stop_codon:yes gene_type:complete
MEKQFKKYLQVLILCFAAAMLGFGLINVFLDVFGLFGFKNKDQVRVYGEERFSKYLMTFEFVPQNFEGMILGPSLSANLNPDHIQNKNYFNLSLMGARINNVLSLATNVIENNGNIKEAIVCIHPYVTSDTGTDASDFMNPDTYWKAFGSVNLLRVYGLGIIRNFNLWPNKYPKNQYNTNGSNSFEPLFKVENVSNRILEEVNNVKVNEFSIGEGQRKDFEELLTLLQTNNIRTFVYYHPVPYPIFDAYKEEIDQYWEDILSMAKNNQGSQLSFYNFNNPEFYDFSQDVSNYIDHGHLSKKGQGILIQKILTQWEHRNH